LLESCIAGQESPLALLGARGMLSPIDLIQHLSCGMILCAATPPYSIVQINKLAASWVSDDPHALINQPLTAFNANGLYHEWVAAIAQAARTRTGTRVESALPCDDGRSRHVTILCMPLPEQDGVSSDQVLSLLIDTPITPPVARTPRDELHQLETSLASFPLPLWLFDGRGRLRFVNEATLRLFHVDTFASFVALVGLTVAEQEARLRPRLTSSAIIANITEKCFTTGSLDRLASDGPDEGQRWASERRRAVAEPITRDELAISRALSKHAVTNQLISIIHPHLDTEIIVRASAAPIVNPAGRVFGAYYITEDVTDEMLLHGQRDATLAITGHDVRNQLTSAKARLQLLQRRLERTGGDEREISTITGVLEQIQRIDQITSDLDAMAAITRGDTLDDSKACDIAALSHEVAQMQMQRHPEVRVQVQSVPDTIRGSWGRRHLKYVLSMLVSSAARRTPPGHSVTVRLKQLRHQVRVEVMDQGETLPPERLEAWNAVLARGEAVLAFEEGNDLDLSIVQTLLSLYRSRLQVSARPRQGMILWFLLPMPSATHLARG
jgi:signal transduction histidine kinase